MTGQLLFDWCQRWRAGGHSFRHRSEGGFNPGRYEVVELQEGPAKTFVVEHHYSRSIPATRLRYGLIDRESGGLCGVAILSVPMSDAVLTRVFPGLEPLGQTLELGRFVLLDEVPANGESWMLARVFRQAAMAGIRGVVSFSDPTPRRSVAGAVVMPGHVGTIYAASNAVYTGRGTARTLVLLPDGSVLSARALQKVRAQERGHAHVERRLVALGAPEPNPACPALWLREALTTLGTRTLRHRGNHRFAFRIGRDRRERDAVVVAMPARPYPKRIDAQVAA